MLYAVTNSDVFVAPVEAEDWHEDGLSAQQDANIRATNNQDTSWYVHEVITTPVYRVSSALTVTGAPISGTPV